MKVKKLDERDIPTGKKLKLGLEEEEEILVEQWVSFSTWQLKDGFENRLKQWGERQKEKLENEEISVTEETEV